MARIALVSFLVAAVLSGCGEAQAPRAAVTERPEGTIVFLTDDNRLTAIDVASGQRVTRRIRSVPSCGAELYTTGGHIVFSGVIKGSTTVFSIPLTLDRRPRRLGVAHAFVPSTTDGRVWLAGSDCDRTRMVGVREMTVGGEVTFENDRPVPAETVVGAVPEGLVVSRGSTMSIWDPVTGAARGAGLGWAFGIEGPLLAGCVAVDACNELTIVDTGSGRTVPVPGRLDMGGRFSPDGAWLATAARNDRRWRVALVDTSSGASRIISGSRTGKVYPDVRWSRTSGWLFIRAGRRVLAYRPGASRAERLPIRVPEWALGFTVG
jgi:hypothetical protein